MTLQKTDLDRFFFVRIAHASLFTKNLRRTNPGAHAAHNVLAQDCVCGTAEIVAANFLDETGNINSGWTRNCAGRVVTKVAAVRLDQCLGVREWRVQVTEVFIDLRLLESPWPDLFVTCHRYRLTATGSASRACLCSAS